MPWPCTDKISLEDENLRTIEKEGWSLPVCQMKWAVENNKDINPWNWTTDDWIKFCAYLTKDDSQPSQLSQLTQEPEFRLNWHTRYINDIESNGVECWWTLGSLGGIRRFFKVVPYSRCDTDGLVLKEHAYFALYESLTEDETQATVVAVYESKDEAMERVKTQLTHIYAISQGVL